MAQDLTRLVAGNFLWYAREGTTIDGVVVSAANAAPDNAPETNWTSMGCIESMSIDTPKTIWEPECPTVTGYETDAQHTLKKDIIFTITFNEISNVFWQMLLNTSGPVPDNAVSGYVPNDDSGLASGWWKFQIYDTIAGLIKTNLDIYGTGQINTSPNLDNQGTTWSMDLKLTRSTHNAGGLYRNTWTAPA